MAHDDIVLTVCRAREPKRNIRCHIDGVTCFPHLAPSRRLPALLARGTTPPPRRDAPRGLHDDALSGILATSPTSR